MCRPSTIGNQAFPVAFATKLWQCRLSIVRRLISEPTANFPVEAFLLLLAF